MNVSFNLENREKDDHFYKSALKENMICLNGHAKYGGCRASMYNAMPVEGAEKLRTFMKKYQDENQKL